MRLLIFALSLSQHISTPFVWAARWYECSAILFFECLFTILFKTDPPTPTAQRQLILLGKVLQYLASHALPGVKEEYMQNLNAFIANNQDDLQAFYDDVLVCLSFRC